ncbi:MAG: inositol phosphate phosphatase SopB [Endozoicomonas sp.]
MESLSRIFGRAQPEPAKQVRTLEELTALDEIDFNTLERAEQNIVLESIGQFRDEALASLKRSLEGQQGNPKVTWTNGRTVRMVTESFVASSVLGVAAAAVLGPITFAAAAVVAGGVSLLNGCRHYIQYDSTRKKSLEEYEITVVQPQKRISDEQRRRETVELENRLARVRDQKDDQLMELRKKVGTTQQQHRQEKEGLQGQLDKAEEEYIQKNQEVARYKDLAGVWSEEVARVDAENEKLLDDNARQLKQYQGVQKSLKKAQRRCDAIAEEKKLLQEQLVEERAIRTKDKGEKAQAVIDLERELKEKNQEQAASQVELRERKGELEEVSRELAERETALRKAEKTHSGQVEELKAQLTKLEQGIEKDEKLRDQRRLEHEEDITEKARLSTKVAGLEDELRQLQEASNKSTETQRHNEQKIRQLSGELEETKVRLKDNNTAAQKRDVELDQLVGKIEAMEDEAQSKELELNNKLGELDKLQEQLAAQESKFKDAHQSDQRKVTELERELQLQSQENEKLLSGLRDGAEKLETATKERDAFLLEIEALKQQLRKIEFPKKTFSDSEVQADLNDPQKIALETRVQQVTEQLRQKEADIVTFKQDLARITETLKEKEQALQQKGEARREEISRPTSELDGLKSQLENEEGAVANTAEKLEEANEKLLTESKAEVEHVQSGNKQARIREQEALNLVQETEGRLEEEVVKQVRISGELRPLSEEKERELSEASRKIEELERIQAENVAIPVEVSLKVDDTSPDSGLSSSQSSSPDIIEARLDSKTQQAVSELLNELEESQVLEPEQSLVVKQAIKDLGSESPDEETGKLIEQLESIVSEPVPEPVDSSPPAEARVRLYSQSLKPGSTKVELGNWKVNLPVKKEELETAKFKWKQKFPIKNSSHIPDYEKYRLDLAFTHNPELHYKCCVEEYFPGLYETLEPGQKGLVLASELADKVSKTAHEQGYSRATVEASRTLASCMSRCIPVFVSSPYDDQNLEERLQQLQKLQQELSNAKKGFIHSVGTAGEFTMEGVYDTFTGDLLRLEKELKDHIRATECLIRNDFAGKKQLLLGEIRLVQGALMSLDRENDKSESKLQLQKKYLGELEALQSQLKALPSGADGSEVPEIRPGTIEPELVAKHHAKIEGLKKELKEVGVSKEAFDKGVEIALNENPWDPISKTFVMRADGKFHYYKVDSIPVGALRWSATRGLYSRTEGEKDGKKDLFKLGDGGRGSKSPRDEGHAVNAWLVRMYDEAGKPVMSKIRSAVPVPFPLMGEKSHDEVLEYTINRLKKEITMMVLETKGDSEDFLEALEGPDKVMDFTCTHASLLTPDLVRKLGDKAIKAIRKLPGFKGAADKVGKAVENEAAMLGYLEEAVEKLKKSTLELEFFDEDGNTKTLKVNYKGIPFSFPMNKMAQNRLSSTWVNADPVNEKGAQEYFGGLDLQAPLTGMVGDFMNNPNSKDEDKLIVAKKARQMQYILKHKLHHTNASMAMKLPSLVNDIGYYVVDCNHDFCKSGKDRTGIQNAMELAEFAELHATGKVAPLSYLLTPDQYYSAQSALATTAQSEICQQNMAGAGMKINVGKEETGKVYDRIKFKQSASEKDSS